MLTNEKLDLMPLKCCGWDFSPGCHAWLVQVFKEPPTPIITMAGVQVTLSELVAQAREALEVPALRERVRELDAELAAAKALLEQANMYMRKDAETIERERLEVVGMRVRAQKAEDALAAFRSPPPAAPVCWVCGGAVNQDNTCTLCGQYPASAGKAKERL